MKQFKRILYWIGVVFLGLVFINSAWSWLNNLENMPKQDIAYNAGSTLAVIFLGWLFWWILPVKNKKNE